MKLFRRSSLRLKTVLHPSRLWTDRLYRRPKCFRFYVYILLERPLNATCFWGRRLFALFAFSLLRFSVLASLSFWVFASPLKQEKKERIDLIFSRITHAQNTHLKKEKKERLSRFDNSNTHRFITLSFFLSFFLCVRVVLTRPPVRVEYTPK